MACVIQQLAILRMNAKLQVLLFALVLLASVISEGDSFTSAGGHTGRKRSNIQMSEESNTLPLRTRNLHLTQKDSDVVRVRRDQLCEYAKRTC
ncbi:hypothetical protein ACROYT_G009978 [Oculina patagonica]